MKIVIYQQMNYYTKDINVLLTKTLLYIVNERKELLFVLVGLSLDDPCYLDRQCTATPNAGVCMADQNDKLVCQCKTGYTRHTDSCLQGRICNLSKRFQLYTSLVIQRR